MKITADHPASSYGTPVILDDAGQVMDYKPGVKAVRESLGLTQAEFAARLGVSTRAVSNWEQGLDTPRADRLNAMAALLAPKRRKASK